MLRNFKRCFNLSITTRYLGSDEIQYFGHYNFCCGYPLGTISILEDFALIRSNEVTRRGIWEISNWTRNYVWDWRVHWAIDHTNDRKTCQHTSCNLQVYLQPDIWNDFKHTDGLWGPYSYYDFVTLKYLINNVTKSNSNQKTVMFSSIQPQDFP